MARKKRKRSVLTFSGPFSDDLSAHLGSAAKAVEVRVTRRGYLIYAVDQEDDVLADETQKYVQICDDEVIASSTDAADLADLFAALEVSELTGGICMCSGDLAFEFLDASGLPVEVLRLHFPDSLSWRFWLGDARLTNPSRLQKWLEDHDASST